ncbi:hypothetical protein JCM16303_004549 [Sporobolomyces ruberrimus]
MTVTHHKVVYKPDSMSTEEYIIIIQDVDAANKWIAGGESCLLLPHSVLFPPRSSLSSSLLPSLPTSLPFDSRLKPLVGSPRPLRSLFLVSLTCSSIPSLRSTIPLVDIVDSFDVFTTGQGAQGILERPSKQVLDTVFNSTNQNDIVEIVLEKGRILSGTTPHRFGSKNDQRSGNYQSSAGSGAHGGR